MAARRERGLFDPDAAPGESPFDHHIYVIASRRRHRGGRHLRGVLARRHPAARQPDRVYDDNQISIEDDTAIALQRGHRARATRRTAGTCRSSRAARTSPAILAGACDARRKAETDRPSFIRCAPSSAGPAPNKRTPARRTARRSARTRSPRPRRSSASTRTSPSRSTTRSSRTPARSSSAGSEAHAGVARVVRRVGRGEPERKAAARPADSRATLPDGWAKALPTCEPDAEGRGHPQGLRRGARRAGRRCCPSCGAARPTWPSATTPRWRARPRSARQTHRHQGCGTADPYGRTLHFGIREHAMGAILNGIALHGPTRAVRRHVPDRSATTCAAPCGWPR